MSSSSAPKNPSTARWRPTRNRRGARSYSKSTPTKSTASSSRCPTSAKSAASWTPFASPACKVPVLVQATPDRSDAMTIAVRRDSFCGKMSACNNLMQYGIPYSLTTLHTESAHLARVHGRSGMVLRRLPHRQGPEESAHRRHRRASGGLQHGALLRALL